MKRDPTEVSTSRRGSRVVSEEEFKVLQRRASLSFQEDVDSSASSAEASIGQHWDIILVQIWSS